MYNRKNGETHKKIVLSLIIPCYNEQEALPFFYQKVGEVLRQMECDYELLFINDGSKDETLGILRRLAADDEHVSYLSFSRNFGKEAAMYAGFQNVSGDYVAVMDADLQDPPSLLPQMLEILQTGEYDSVATRRVNREGEPLVRSWFAKKFYQVINRISDVDIVDGARDFRMMRREVANAIVALGEYNRFSKGIYGWVGFRTYWFPYENVERVAGQTKWGFWKLFKYAINGIVSFSQAASSSDHVVGTSTPASCIFCPYSTKFMLSTVYPSRNFTLTGHLTAAFTLLTIATAKSGVFISAEPSPPFTTLFTGQPIFISIISAYGSRICAAFAINSGL